MSASQTENSAGGSQERLLATLERLLALEATEVKDALDRASQLVAEALNAEKVDAFLLEPGSATLVAVGVSDTPLGRHQRAIGMDRLPLANGGRTVGVFQTGLSFSTGRTDQDPDELIGIKEGLGVRSTMAVVLEINGERRGVLCVHSQQSERFTADDLRFVEAVARWVSLVLQRAELVERITRETSEQARRVVADELILILAHDLRAPLTPLAGYIGMLRMQAQRDGRERDLHYAEAAHRVVERLNRLIADMLDVGRLEQGIFGLRLETVDLAELAQQCAETLRTETSNVQVRGPNTLTVMADPNRLRQALENLLSNAIRHSPEGVAVILDMGTEAREDGDWAILRVRDGGPGIAPDLLPRLFERFASGNATHGLGLGLYIARGIAEAHSGSLTADSTPGQGATFSLALPIRDKP